MPLGAAAVHFEMGPGRAVTATKKTHPRPAVPFAANNTCPGRWRTEAKPLQTGKTTSLLILIDFRRPGVEENRAEQSSVPHATCR